MITMTRRELKQLARTMRTVLDSEAPYPQREMALGVVLLLMGSLPQPNERRCAWRDRTLAQLPAQWPETGE